MSEPNYLVARCRKGCVTGWSLVSLPRAEVAKFIGNARDRGYQIEQSAVPPPKVDFSCEH